MDALTWQALSVPSEVITLVVPASGEYSEVVCAGLAALGSRLGWSDGSIGDLRASVDSATAAVAGPNTSAQCVTLRVTIASDSGGTPPVRVEMEHDGKAISSEACGTLTAVIEATAAEVKVGGRVVTFTCNQR